MEEISDSLVSHTYSLPFDDHLMEDCIPSWSNNDDIKDIDLSSDEDGIIMVVHDDYSKDESLNTFLLNEDGDVIDLKSLPPIDHGNSIFDDGIDANDIDSLLEKFEESNKNMRTITRTNNVPRSNSMPLFGSYKGEYLCIDELNSPKSTFDDIDNLTPPKNFASIEPIEFISPDIKSSSRAVNIPVKSRGKTLRRLVSAMSGVSKIAIPKDAILSSSEDEISPNNKPKIKLIPLTPEFKNDLRRSNRIAKVPIKSLDSDIPIVNIDKPDIISEKSQIIEITKSDIDNTKKNITVPNKQIIELKKSTIEPTSVENHLKPTKKSELEPKILFPKNIVKPNSPLEKSILTNNILDGEKSILLNKKSNIVAEKSIYMKTNSNNIEKKTVVKENLIENNSSDKIPEKTKKQENIKEIEFLGNSRKVCELKKDAHDKCLIPKSSKSYLKKKSKVKRILQPSKSILIPIINKPISKKSFSKRNTLVTMSAPSSPVRSPNNLAILENNEVKNKEKLINDLKKSKDPRKMLMVSKLQKSMNKCESSQTIIKSNDRKQASMQKIAFYVNTDPIKENSDVPKKTPIPIKNEKKECDLPSIPLNNNNNNVIVDVTKKLSLSSYRNRRKIRKTSKPEGRIILVNEPFFKDIPDHSYCNKNKVITNSQIESVLNVQSDNSLPDLLQPVPTRIRCNTDNNSIDMDIDSDYANEDNISNDESNNKLQCTINNPEMTEIKVEPLLKELQPIELEKSKNESQKDDFKKIKNELLDSAVGSPNTSISSDNMDSTNEEINSSPSADSGVSEWPSTSRFKSTFKPIDNKVNDNIPIIFDAHNIKNSNKGQHLFINKSSTIDGSIPSNNNNHQDYPTVLSFNSQITNIYVKPTRDQNNYHSQIKANNDCMPNYENSYKEDSQNKSYDSYNYPEKKVFDRYYNSDTEYESDSSIHSNRQAYNPNYHKRSSKRSKYSRYSRSRSPVQKYMSEYRKKEFEERRIVYVGKIPENYMKSDLEKKFESFGQIDDISIHIREYGDNFGFITYRYTKDAFNAIEKGNTIEGCKDFDMCFGGRRHFCKQRYADLDGNLQDDEESGYVDNGNAEMDFDSMLKAAKKDIKHR